MLINSNILCLVLVPFCNVGYIDPDGGKFDDGEPMWIRKNDQGILRQPFHKPKKFGIRSEDFWQKVLEELKKQNKPLPKEIFFYNSNNSSHGYEEWCKANQIPEKPNIKHLNNTLRKFDMFGMLYRSGGDVSTQRIGNRESLREFYYLKPKASKE